MHKKNKNIINAANVSGKSGIESGLKTGPAGSSPDIKITSGYSDLSSGEKAYIRSDNAHSTLSVKLYLLILIGLSVAVILLLTGFGLNFLDSAGNLNSVSLQEHTLSPIDLADAIKNNQTPSTMLISYAGLIALILVPAAGLIYTLGYFTYRKQYKLALTTAGVLFILTMSAVIGLLIS